MPCSVYPINPYLEYNINFQEDDKNKNLKFSISGYFKGSKIAIIRVITNKSSDRI
jgi:hypothetical protein